MMIPRPGRLFNQVSLQDVRLILQNFLADSSADLIVTHSYEKEFLGFASLAAASPQQISFWTGENQKELTATEAGLILIPAAKMQELATISGLHSFPTRILAVSDVWPAFLHLLQRVWDSEAEQNARNEYRAGSIGKNCQIAANCVISDFCVVGDNCTLHPGVVLYPGVKIGAGTVIHSNSVIGQRGFGFYPSQSGLVKIEHYGGVIIGESCELGAQTSIAAGMLEPTTLGNGCCLDSQVHIAHNCRLGDECFIAAQCALAGRVEFASQVQMGGGSKVDNGVFVGQGAKISAMSGVTHNVKPGEHVCGFPARPVAQWRREQARLRFRNKGRQQ